MSETTSSAEYAVIGLYTEPHAAAHAIEKLRAAGHEKVNYFSPFPDHHLEAAAYAGKKRSWVRIFTLVGGLTGCLGAFLFTTWMSIDYPLRVSAKPLVSIPAFIIIAFECTILLGAIFTLLGMGHLSRIPNLTHTPTYRPECSNDHFAVTVQVPKDETEGLQEEMERLGAKSIEVQYVR